MHTRILTTTAFPCSLEARKLEYQCLPSENLTS